MNNAPSCNVILCAGEASTGPKPGWYPLGGSSTTIAQETTVQQPTASSAVTSAAPTTGPVTPGPIGTATTQAPTPATGSAPAAAPLGAGAASAAGPSTAGPSVGAGPSSSGAGPSSATAMQTPALASGVVGQPTPGPLRGPLPRLSTVSLSASLLPPLAGHLAVCLEHQVC